jgi:ubiquitin-protein ligase
MVGPLLTDPTSLVTTINHYIPETPLEHALKESSSMERLRAFMHTPQACELCSHTYTPILLAKLVCPTLSYVDMVQTTTQTLHCHCPSCNSSICIACLRKGCDNTCTAKPDSCVNIAHCSNSRVLLLYRILASLDKFYLFEKRSEKVTTQSNNPISNGSGTGYATGHRISRQSSIIAPARPSGQRDMQLLSFFRGVGWILATSATDMGLLDILRLSLLDVAIEEFLRNDSISDLSEKLELCASFLTCLESIGKNPYLVEFYTEKRTEVAYSDGLEQIIGGNGRKTAKAMTGENDDRRSKTGLPLLSLMEKVCQQAETFCRTTGNAHRQLNLEDIRVVNSINLCRSILAVRSLLQTTAIRCGLPISHSAERIQSEKETYALICAQLAYDELSNAYPNLRYHYVACANSLASTNPRRTITLAKELSTMATSLPPGIFVRSLPNRPDCIKVLIAGPEGTPYFGGLFEFDIFATANYPSEAPKVHFMTTSQNRVRFNPNLYAYFSLAITLIQGWESVFITDWNLARSA